MYGPYDAYDYHIGGLAGIRAATVFVAIFDNPKLTVQMHSHKVQHVF
jgi:hypothetical protein